MAASRVRSRRAARNRRNGSICGSAAASVTRPISGPGSGRRSSSSWRCTSDPETHEPVPPGQVRGLRQRADRVRPRRERGPLSGLRRHRRETDGREGRDPRRGPGGPRVMAEAKTAAARGYDWPDEGDLVVCTVTNVKNFGAFVTLDEYEAKEGFIHIAEVSSGWIKYIRDYIREGQKVVCKVLKVDKEKGHIDLSLKAVNEHQRREKIQEWKNEQKAENLFAIVAQRLGKTVDECWQEFGYDLLDSFGSLYRAFEESVMDEHALEDEGFKGPWVKTFVEVARENIVPPHVTIDGYVEAMDFCPDGAVHIREALTKAVQENDGITVKVQYIGAPRYRIVVRAPDYKTAEEEIEKAANRVIKALTAKGGEAKFHRKD